MTLVTLARWGQVIGLSIGAIASLIFLLQYRRTWNLSNAYTRFVIELNVLFILSVIAVILGRLFPAILIIEIIKAVLFLGVSLSLMRQVFLYRGVRNNV